MPGLGDRGAGPGHPQVHDGEAGGVSPGPHRPHGALGRFEWGLRREPPVVRSAALWLGPPVDRTGVPEVCDGFTRPQTTFTGL